MLSDKILTFGSALGWGWGRTTCSWVDYQWPSHPFAVITDNTALITHLITMKPLDNHLSLLCVCECVCSGLVVILLVHLPQGWRAGFQNYLGWMVRRWTYISQLTSKYKILFDSHKIFQITSFNTKYKKSVVIFIILVENHKTSSKRGCYCLGIALEGL